MKSGDSEVICVHMCVLSCVLSFFCKRRVCVCGDVRAYCLVVCYVEERLASEVSYIHIVLWCVLMCCCFVVEEREFCDCLIFCISN